jgi:hypothetical protein
MIGEKILTNSGYMGPGVNLLENYVLLLHKWNCNPYILRLLNYRL